MHGGKGERGEGEEELVVHMRVYVGSCEIVVADCINYQMRTCC